MAKKKSILRRLVSVLLCVCMVLPTWGNLLPVLATGSAADGGYDDPLFDGTLSLESTVSSYIKLANGKLELRSILTTMRMRTTSALSVSRFPQDSTPSPSPTGIPTTITPARS